jgi:hypothetical protein
MNILKSIHGLEAKNSCPKENEKKFKIKYIALRIANFEGRNPNQDLDNSEQDGSDSTKTL